jgi:hypothetical protein
MRIVEGEQETLTALMVEAGGGVLTAELLLQPAMTAKIPAAKPEAAILRTIRRALESHPVSDIS